jgi:hypothetical protein
MAVIGYVCTTPAHRNGAVTSDHLTIHERAWAYCPHDSRADGHTWEATGGIEFTELQLRIRRASDRSPTA